MMWTNKGFEMWMGNAGNDAARSADAAAPIGFRAFEPTLVTSDDCTDAAARKAGWLSRTIAAVSDRTQLPRIARG